LAQSAQRPASPAAAHLFFNRPLPLSPLGLSLSAGPARRLSPVDRASVAPCSIAASHSRKRISRKPPSLHECVLRRESATSARPISAGPATTPTGLGLPAGPNRPAHLASPPFGPCLPLAYFADEVFFFDSRLPFLAPSLSPLTDAWALLVSSFLHPVPADPDCATTESRCARPLCAAAPPLEMPP
jgi:hypothetical protein